MVPEASLPAAPEQPRTLRPVVYIYIYIYNDVLCVYIYIYIYSSFATERVHLLRVVLLRVLESNFPGDSLQNYTDTIIPTPHPKSLRRKSPSRAASLFLVSHTARAASGRLIPTPHSLFSRRCCTVSFQNSMFVFAA